MKKITILSFGTDSMWNLKFERYTLGISAALNAQVTVVVKILPAFSSPEELKAKVVEVINQIHGDHPEIEPISLIFTDFLDKECKVSAEFRAIKDSNLDFTELGIRFVDFYWQVKNPDCFDKFCVRIFESSIRGGDSQSYLMPREFWIQNPYRSVHHLDRETSSYYHLDGKTGSSYISYEPGLDYPRELEIYSPIAFSKPEPTRNELYRKGLMQNLFRGRKFQ